MSKIVIFGAGKIADEAYYYLTNDSPHEIVAFTVDKAFLSTQEKLGLPVIPFDEVQNKYPPGDFKMFVAVGYQDLNKFRAQKYTNSSVMSVPRPLIMGRLRSAITVLYWKTRSFNHVPRLATTYSSGAGIMLAIMPVLVTIATSPAQW
jgi:hypothetical protein